MPFTSWRAASVHRPLPSSEHDTVLPHPHTHLLHSLWPFAGFQSLTQKALAPVLLPDGVSPLFLVHRDRYLVSGPRCGLQIPLICILSSRSACQSKDVASQRDLLESVSQTFKSKRYLLKGCCCNFKGTGAVA